MEERSPAAAAFGPHRELELLPGRREPLGATATEGGVNFAVFSSQSSRADLVLFPEPGGGEVEIPLDPAVHRSGAVWHAEVLGVGPGIGYVWKLRRHRGGDEPTLRGEPGRLLLDPYARALERKSPRGGSEAGPGQGDGRWLCVVTGREEGGAQSEGPRFASSDRIIYELHVRGFTHHPSSGVDHPGTYRGVVEKIPYLEKLGVTTVELLPIFEFDELQDHRRDPLTGERLGNYWGYSPIAFFAPKGSYSSDRRRLGQLVELETMVRELHRAGLEVLLDVVFNHTAEGRGEPRDPTYSFRGLDEAVYYLRDPDTGDALDFTGCGNTVSCNHPVVQDLIVGALRYWVEEVGVDGFRFDLAPILTRGADGRPLADPPVLRRIAADRVLSRAVLIAEPWDAAGLHLQGAFPSWGPWAEWNGLFRDHVRRFVRGEPGFARHLATRLAGSSDLYWRWAAGPGCSVNFVASHDGFTVADLVSYSRKYNWANGEANRDGSDHELSWNCGWEGPTADPDKLALRRRQVRNLLTLLLLAQGTPMLQAGDELGRSQVGNNNPYCQDNEVTWLDWNLAEENADLLRFVRLLVGFRRAHAIVRRRTFLTGRGTRQCPRPDVTWHGVRLGQPDWGPRSRVLAMHLAGAHAPVPDCDLYLAANASPHPLEFELPALDPGGRWLRVVDTARPSPNDIIEPGREPPVGGARSLRVDAFSCIVLRSTGAGKK